MYRYFNFQYFLLDTYVGYFLQVLPIAVLAGCLALRHRRRHTLPGEKPRQQLLWFVFAAYLAALLTLTLLPHGLLRTFWYLLFFGRDSGWTLDLSFGGISLIPDFFFRFRTENLGNLLLFLPFGVLCPLLQTEMRWRDAVKCGFFLSLTIELLQPFLGRSFDTNDLILNTLGAALGAGFTLLLRRLMAKLKLPKTMR